MRESFFLLAAVVVAGGIFPGYSAQIGDKAARLEIAEWIKGQPVDVTDGKNIYVVEFWATWCPPCRTSIPHLTALQNRFQSKGVVIIGISNESVDKVKSFVKDMGNRMNYRVAVDKNRQTGNAYMRAFNQNGIPHAFIVDKRGRIAWHGHPMSLERAIEKVLDGGKP